MSRLKLSLNITCHFFNMPINAICVCVCVICNFYGCKIDNFLMKNVIFIFV